jgi:hypothetical protein
LFDNEEQVQQLAAMAGVPLSQGHVSCVTSCILLPRHYPKGNSEICEDHKACLVWYLANEKNVADTQQVSAFSHPVGADCLDQEFSATTNSHQQKGGTACHEAST